MQQTGPVESADAGEQTRGLKRALEKEESFAPATKENPLGLPGVGAPDWQNYKIITGANTHLPDVVCEADMNMLQKLAQVTFAFYTHKKTALIYITRDDTDHAYEVTFQLPGGGEYAINYAYLSLLYKVCPPLILDGPSVDSCNLINDLGETELVNTVTLRYASYRRPYVSIKKSILLLMETESAPIRTSDIVGPSPAKKRRVETATILPFDSSGK